MGRHASRTGSTPPRSKRLPIDDLAGERGRAVLSSGSADETLAIGRAIGAAVPPGAVLSLEGGLGAGKTLIAKGIGAGLGVPDEITSPSFVLIEEYRGELPLLHVDLYRLERLEEVEAIGLFDSIDGRSVVVIEWGDRLPPNAVRIDIRIHLRVTGPESRSIEVEAPLGMLSAIGRPQGRKP